MYTEIPDEQADDPWFKVVDFLQHNWAVIVPIPDCVKVVFYGDTRGIFDELRFDSPETATDALRRNGFSRYRDDAKASEFIALPVGEFHEREHPNGRIYSSGRHWR
jgi:hypothetical protein